MTPSRRPEHRRGKGKKKEAVKLVTEHFRPLNPKRSPTMPSMWTSPNRAQKAGTEAEFERAEWPAMSRHAFYELRRAIVVRFNDEDLRVSNMISQSISRVKTTPAEQATISRNLVDIQRPDDPALPQIYRLQDRDGNDLVIYWAQGLRFPWRRNVDVPSDALNSIQRFLGKVNADMPHSDKRHPISKVPYPPNASAAKKKQMDDLRKRQWNKYKASREEEYKDSGGWGVFHFGYWIAQGQKGVVPASMTQDTVKGTNVRRNAVYQLFKDLAVLVQTIGRLFEELRPTDYQSYRNSYNSVCRKPNCMLQAYTLSNRACWHCFALLINAQVKPHKDDNNHKEGWVGMTCLGDFTGGALVLPRLNRRIHFRPGDFILFRSALLEHWLENFEGYRYSLVFFTKQNTFETAPC